MKKIFIVDFSHTRFQCFFQGYERLLYHGLKPYFFSLQKTGLIQFILTLIAVRPDALVVTQWFYKKIDLLLIIANFLGIKTLFFQHGIVLYKSESERKRTFLAQFITIDEYFALSQYDIEQMSMHYNIISATRIPFYENIRMSLEMNSNKSLTIVYIDQKCFVEQANNKILYEFSKGFTKGREFFDYLVELSQTEGYRLMIKKHPGDDTSFYKELAESRPWISIHEKDIPNGDVYTCHYSTLGIAPLQCGKYVIVLPGHTNSTYTPVYSHYSSPGCTTDNITYIDDIDQFRKLLHNIRLSLDEHRKTFSNQNFEDKNQCYWVNHIIHSFRKSDLYL